MTNNISVQPCKQYGNRLDEDGFTPNPCELVIQRP